MNIVWPSLCLVNLKHRSGLESLYCGMHKSTRKPPCSQRRPTTVLQQSVSKTRQQVLSCPTGTMSGDMHKSAHFKPMYLELCVFLSRDTNCLHKRGLNLQTMKKQVVRVNSVIKRGAFRLSLQSSGLQIWSSA